MYYAIGGVSTDSLLCSKTEGLILHLETGVAIHTTIVY